MVEVKLPFWVVTERRGETPARVDPFDDQAAMCAFTSTEKMTAYLDRRRPGGWKFTPVTDGPELVLTLAAAHRTGARLLCFDPEPDGSGGEYVLLGELFGLADVMASA